MSRARMVSSPGGMITLNGIAKHYGARTLFSGVNLTIGASDRTIRLLFGVLIVVIALIYGGTEAAALF